MQNYDLIILGGGAAAFAAAMKANELKARTLMVNNNKVGIGGTCVNVGCLPTKHLLYIGELIYLANNHNFKGLKSEAKIDFPTLIKEKDALVKKLRDEKYSNVLKNLKYVSLVQGQARFISRNKIKVNNKLYEAGKFVIATGSSTFIPNVKGIDKINYLTNIETLKLKRKPMSLIVLGGGALGVEFAQMFSRFGTKVCLLQSTPRLVPREEPELAYLLQKYLEQEGIEICTSVEIKEIIKKGKEKIVTALVNNKIKKYKSEEILIATGRRPNTSNFGLEITKVKLDKNGAIIVNNEMQATENIWAAGDVKGEPMLETVAAKEGAIAANNALDNEKKKMNYSIVPHAIFTNPQLASVGLTDEQAIKNKITCNCRTITMGLVPKAQAIKDVRGAIKLVINNKTNVIIGCHVLSPYAADIIHEAAFIIKSKMTIYDVVGTLHVFPTMSESIKIVAQSFVRDVKNMSCCVE